MNAPPRRLAPTLLALALAAAAGPVSAQVTPPAAAPDSVRPVVVRADTAPADTARAFGVSPRGAFLRSLAVPGWGQSATGAPARGGIYFALEAGSLWMVYKSDRKLAEAERQEAELRRTGQLAPTARSPLVRDRRNQREDWITLSVFWAFFAGADAFVGAYLRDFDANVGVIPTPGGGVGVQATIPVSGP